MTAERITVTMVNHVAMEISASPDAVWQVILDDYVNATKFREIGAVEPIDDPAALLGGYRTRIEHNGAIVDERIVHITERDEKARRVSAFADYLSVPGGLQVYASYHAREAPGGTLYTIDCHSRPTIDVPAGGKDALMKLISTMQADADAHMIGYLEGVKARLESAT